MVDRRVFLQTASGLFAAAAWATGAFGGEQITSHDQVFFNTPLGSNSLARRFLKPRVQVSLPATQLLGRDGFHNLSKLKGKTRIVSLWSEWCAPCLAEARDLAPLQQQFAGSSFEILAVLTKSGKGLDYAGASDVLNTVKAGALPLWVEPNGGDTIYQSATSQLGPGIPLLLLVDDRGGVFGYCHGAPSDIDVAKLGIHLKPGGVLSAKDQEILKTATEKSGTLWRSDDAKAFVRALAAHNFKSQLS